MQDTGCKIQDTGYWMMDTRYWILGRDPGRVVLRDCCKIDIISNKKDHERV